MKLKSIAALSLLVGSVFMTSCATTQPVGAIYTEVKLPVAVTSDKKSTKVGVAECKSILGLVAIGDASIEAAKKNGGITTVTHIDWDVENILGVVGKYKCTVYGN